MKKTKTYENFPLWMVFLSNVVAISIYAIGAYILAWFGILVSIIYLLYCLFIEIRILKQSCINCYYFGKLCAFGKGKLCSLFFKKGNSKEFIKKDISWSSLLPDFMVSIIPLVGAIILLVKDFNWVILMMLAILLLLSFGGNAFIRGSLACKYCKQREIGCPAEKLFNKGKIE